ncbi:glycosyltransferase [Desulfovibrio sp. ZJ200]|uniref:glycosyltransferase n=1 Tax=Desulfovibrio sp. ZJ200 TaxID=2709792 RepID=UPI0013EDE751|nr:glycosyltransferase [Desulfovibrio sp. ZJ200]
MENNLSSQKAFKLFKNRNYKESLAIYEMLSDKIGFNIYRTNVLLCKNKINSNSLIEPNYQKRICIITHELTYTGAPGSSLRMASCLNNFYHVEIVSPVDGDYRKEIEKNGITIKIIDQETIDNTENSNYFKSFDLIIANTIALSCFVKRIKKYATTIWYIREAQNITGYHIGRQKELMNYPFTVCVSNYAADFIRKNYTPYVQELRNFVIDKYSGEENLIKEKVKILFCGTISARKGLDILLNAVDHLSDKHKKNIEIHIVGRKLNCFRKYLDSLADMLNRPWIIDHGEVSDEDKKTKLFSEMNIFVIPSRDESFSNVALEGLMHGKLVIVSTNVGAKEILDNSCSFVFDNEDCNALQNILEYILDHRDLPYIMGKNARNVFLQKGTISTFEDKLLDLVDGWLKIKKFKNRQNYYFKTYNDLIGIIKSKIAELRELNITSVVGIPRSGMIPAYIIGNFLNIPVYSINEFVCKIKNTLTGRNIETRKGKIMVIDDSILSGKSIEKAKNMLLQYNLHEDYVYSAVYATQKSKLLVDFYFDETTMPRIFEWNYLNHPHCIHWAFDIDGVLCVDPTEEENDDGDNYINFLINAKPLFIPNYTIGAIITSRLEKYRPQTEAWLMNNNVKYNHLIMLNLPSKKERIIQNAHAKIKWEHYKYRDDLCLFVESEEKQAMEIAKNSGKAVICTQNNMLY